MTNITTGNKDLLDTGLKAAPPTKQANSPLAGDNLVDLPADIVGREQNLNYPDELTATITIDPELFQNENDPLNPVQQNAYIEDHDRGKIEFRGKIYKVRRSEVGGDPVAVITALDKMQVLNEALALYNDGTTTHKVWSRETPALAINQETFEAGNDYGDGFRNVWYATSSSAAWLSNSRLNSTLTTSATVAAATEMRLGATHPGWPPRGFISNTGRTDIREYDGLTYDQGAGIWIAQNLIGNSLGTTSGTIGSGSTVWGLLSKRIHDRTVLEVEGLDSGTWEPIEDSNYEPSWGDGGVIFNQDPLKLKMAVGGGALFTAIRITYAVYDEEGGNELALSGVLKDLMETDPALGGVGFKVGFTDTCRPVIVLTPEIYLTRIECREPTSCLDFIRKLLFDLELLKGTDNDAIVMKYHAIEDEMRIVTISQAAAGSPDKRYSGEQTKSEDASLEDVRTAIVAQFDQGDNANLMASNRIWHEPTSGSPGGATPFVYQLANGAWAIPVTFQPRATAAVQEAVAGVVGVPINLLTDNEANSGFGLFYDSAAGAQGTNYYSWFPGASDTAPDLHWVDEIEWVFEVVGDNTSVAPGNGFQAEIEAYQTFTGSHTSTPPTAGSAFSLSPQLSVKFTPGVMGYTTVNVKARRLLFPCRALGLNITYPLIDPASPFSGKFGFKLLEMKVTGTKVQTEFVELVAAYTGGNTNEIVAPDSFGKLRDSTMNQQKVGILKTGQGTHQVARNFAWLQLLQTLALAQARDYEVDEAGMVWHGVPVASETVEFNDTFAGVIDSVSSARINGERSFNCRAINYLTDLIGAGGV